MAVILFLFFPPSLSLLLRRAKLNYLRRENIAYTHTHGQVVEGHQSMNISSTPSLTLDRVQEKTKIPNPFQWKCKHKTYHLAPKSSKNNFRMNGSVCITRTLDTLNAILKQMLICIKLLSWSPPAGYPCATPLPPDLIPTSSPKISSRIFPLRRQ